MVVGPQIATVPTLGEVTPAGYALGLGSLAIGTVVGMAVSAGVHYVAAPVFDLNPKKSAKMGAAIAGVGGLLSMATAAIIVSQGTRQDEPPPGGMG